MAQASVIIPAHNEAAVIGRCLDSLLQQTTADLEIVVVANGCTDATGRIADSYCDRLPRLRVVDRPEAGKAGALNAGDAAATSFPRIYLDADVVLADGALAPLVEALNTSEPRIAAPRIRFDSTGADGIVEAFYRVFTRLPYVEHGLVGLGLYGMSSAGRARFGSFPEVIADDLFAQRMFAPNERVITPGEFVVRTPRRAADLVAVRTRVARGNAELSTTDGVAGEASTVSTFRSLAVSVARRPFSVVDALVYVGVILVARLRARSGPAAWQRDESSRMDAPDGHSVLEGDAAGPPLVDIDGVSMAAWTQPQVVAHVLSELDGGRGGVILTPNVDIMRQLRKDGAPAESADLIVADGMPIVWASQVQGTPLPERVTGADLVWSLSQAAALRQRGIYLLGGAPGVGERAGRALCAANEGLRLAGHSSPEMGFEKDPATLEQTLADVEAARPDLVFVAMGFPKQERLALLLAERLPSTWFLGCGGALDMAAGDVRRADPRAQALGVEWVHRLAQEPRRLARRYLVDDIPYAVALLSRAVLRRVSRTAR